MGNKPQKKNLIITGPSQGKAELVHRLLAPYAARIGGIATEAIIVDDVHQGVLVRRLGVGRCNRSVVAHVAFTGPGMVHMDQHSYGYSTEAMATIAVPAIKETVARGQPVVIDRISLMHILAREFTGEVLRAYDSRVPTVSVLDPCSHPFTHRLQRRPDALVLRLGNMPRADVETSMFEWLARHMGSPD